MYFETIYEHDNQLDMGSIVLAALHRWKRQEPHRRQRLCRPSVKRRHQYQRERQTAAGEVPAPAPLPLPVSVASGQAIDDQTDAAAESGGGQVAPPAACESARSQRKAGFSRLPPASPAEDATLAVACPRPGCQSSQVVGRPRPELPSPPGVPAEFLVRDSGGDRGLEALRCPACGWCLAVRVGGVWTPLEALLRDTQSRGPGWHRVTSLADRAALYLLVAYIYGERERSPSRREPELRPPPPGDSALLLIDEAGAAVGFATLKRRGQLLRERAGPERFQMDILDTVFVRRAARRRGRAGALLERLAMAAARRSRRLGVTRPTPAMRRLLHAFLAERPWARDLMFEVTWAAGANNRVNIWEQLVADCGAEGAAGGASPPLSA